MEFMKTFASRLICFLWHNPGLLYDISQKACWRFLDHTHNARNTTRVSQGGSIFQMHTRFLRKTCFASATFHRVVYLLWGPPLSTDDSISSNFQGYLETEVFCLVISNSTRCFLCISGHSFRNSKVCPQHRSFFLIFYFQIVFVVFSKMKSN